MPTPELVAKATRAVLLTQFTVLTVDVMMSDPLSVERSLYEKMVRAALEAYAEWLAGFEPIRTAPTDGTEVWVFVGPRDGLPPFESRCAYHPDAGWCADEVRSVLLWKPLPVTALAEE